MTIEEITIKLAQLEQENRELKRRLDESPAYFGKRLTNALVSPNFVSGSSGWRIQDNGNVEFATGTFRGDINLVNGVNEILISNDDPTYGNSIIYLVSDNPTMILNDDGITLNTSSGLAGATIFAPGTNQLQIDAGGTFYEFNDTDFSLVVNNTGKLGTASLKWSDLYTLKYNGSTPLAGTKVYYVADSSGGAVTRKLTFIDGILTSET